MNIPIVDLKVQYQSIKEEIDKAIQSVIENTAFIKGEYVQQFEKDYAEAYGAKGIRVEKAKDLDKAINEMIDFDGPVIFDCVVDENENVYPMIPAGKPHNEMLLGNETEKEEIKRKWCNYNLWL